MPINGKGGGRSFTGVFTKLIEKIVPPAPDPVKDTAGNGSKRVPYTSRKPTHRGTARKAQKRLHAELRDL